MHSDLVSIAAKEVEEPSGKRRRRKSRVSERVDDWEVTPDLVLENIFIYLGSRERLNAALACKRWFNCMFTSSRVWQLLEFDERKFARCKLNVSTRRMQYEIEARRVQLCLKSVGQFFRQIIVKPTPNFYNLHKFLQILASFLSFFEDYPMPICRSFEFTFACATRVHRQSEGNNEEQPGVADANGNRRRNMPARANGGPFSGEVYVFGTGGQILETLRTVLHAFRNLTRVFLCNLLLEKEDAEGLLEPLTNGCCESLRELNLRNCSKQPCSLHEIFSFTQLHTLTLSAANIDDDFLVRVVLDLTELRTLAIETDQFAVLESPRVEAATWQFLRSQTEAAKRPVRVLLNASGNFRSEMVMPESVPVSCIAFTSPYAALTDACALRVADRYADTLEIFAQFGLPRRINSTRKRNRANFSERCDSALVTLVRACTRLHTLVIRERISTCTLLVLATELHLHNMNSSLDFVATRINEANLANQRLPNVEYPHGVEGSGVPSAITRRIFVRRNAVVKRFDWPRRADWDATHYAWLRRTSRSYEATEHEISELLGYDFRMLSDRQFKALCLEKFSV